MPNEKRRIDIRLNPSGFWDIRIRSPDFPDFSDFSRFFRNFSKTMLCTSGKFHTVIALGNTRRMSLIPGVYLLGKFVIRTDPDSGLFPDFRGFSGFAPKRFANKNQL